MERRHDTLIEKLKSLTQKVKEIPNTVKSFDIGLTGLNFTRSSKNFDTLGNLKNSNGFFNEPFPPIKQSTSSISSILKDFPTLHAFTNSTTTKNDRIPFSSSVICQNPFYFNAAPSPR